MEPIGSHLIVILSDPQLMRGLERQAAEDHESHLRLRLAVANALHKLAASLEPEPRTENAPAKPLIAAQLELGH